MKEKEFLLTFACFNFKNKLQLFSKKFDNENPLDKKPKYRFSPLRGSLFQYYNFFYIIYMGTVALLLT